MYLCSTYPGKCFVSTAFSIDIPNFMGTFFKFRLVYVIVNEKKLDKERCLADSECDDVAQCDQLWQGKPDSS